jgi:phosphate starvation-inducible PhoH-like protein
MAKLAKRTKKEPSENHEFLQTEPKEIETLSLAQKKYLNVIKNNILTFATGCAGTGKSYIALSYAAEQLKAKRISKIIITRPLVETGEKLGYLPGPQPLDAKIATPNGWTTMGELKIGDYVIGKNGKPIEVLNIFPKGEKDVYRITTTDGTSTECCADHLWFTTTAKERHNLSSYKLKYDVRKIGSVKSTYDIANSLYDHRGRLNHHIPRNDAVEYDYKEVTIPPYSLGCLLGDGSISNSVCLTNIDADIIERFTTEMQSIGCEVSSSENSIIYNVRNTEHGFNKPARKVQVLDKETGIITIYESTGITERVLGINKSKIRMHCNKNTSTDRYEFSFTNDEVPKYTNIIKNKLEQYDLMFSKSYNKFIPDDYKYNSIEVRLEVLRGLMDTDGTVKKTGESSFTTVSERLADDIIELVRSLGGRATKCMRNRVGRKHKPSDKYNNIIPTVPSYEFTISMPEHYNPFYIPRKAERYSQKYIHKVGIAAIEHIGKKEVQCILVDSNLYLFILIDSNVF